MDISSQEYIRGVQHANLHRHQRQEREGAAVEAPELAQLLHHPIHVHAER